VTAAKTPAKKAAAKKAPVKAAAKKTPAKATKKAAETKAPAVHVTKTRATKKAAPKTAPETMEAAEPIQAPSPEPQPTQFTLPAGKEGGFLRDPILGILSDVLDDMESVRIANMNRVRILTRTEADADGEERGHGLSLDNPEVAKLQATVDVLIAGEKDAILNVQRAVRKHPLAHLQQSARGLGEKQYGRALATIGDPYWNDLHERPRTVSELWAYCGFDVRNGAAPKRTRGQQSNWSENARKRIWVISEALMKGGRKAEGDSRGEQDPQQDRFRIIYDNAKVKYADAVHTVECVRCGPSGKPAQVGSPISDAHRHARALRAVSKELLKEMWRAAKAEYEKE
jgi:hypothetical protein